MSLIKKIATASAVAMMALGMGAASASALDLTGGTYTGTSTSNHTFTIAGAYTISCAASFHGDTENVAGDPASTEFTPTFSGCTFFGLPASVTPTGVWKLTALSKSGSTTTGRIQTTGVVDIAIQGIDCAVTVPAQTFTHGSGTSISGTQVGTAFRLSASVPSIAWASTGTQCPWAPTTSGTDGIYNTNTYTNIPGVSVS